MSIDASTPTLHDALSAKYAAGLEVDGCSQEVILPSGDISNMVSLWDPQSGRVAGLVGRRWSLAMDVRSPQRSDAELSEGISYSADPLRFIIEPIDSYLAARDRLVPLSLFAQRSLGRMVSRLEPLRTDSETPTVERLIRQTPEQTDRGSLESIIHGFLQTGRHNPRYIDYDTAEPELARQGFSVARARLVVPRQCEIEVEAAMHQAGHIREGDDCLTVSFAEAQLWDTLDGTIVTESLGGVVDGTDLMVENAGAEAGFSHLAPHSLARVYELLAGAELAPYRPL